ncbi:MAG: methyltransferase type 11 [Anaerolineales bacterium]|nr:MAG: methyltransferase type 11 [Anaerolineales bacterium]
MNTTEHYIPAMGVHWLTPLYDPLVRGFMREEVIRNQLILQADILPGMKVLDLGCGTASLTTLIKQSHVMASVYGLDADLQILEIARRKASHAEVDIQLDQGMAYQLPYQTAMFDRVVSSLVFHHLDTHEKQLAMGEVFRVLRPGGKFCLFDIGQPHSLSTRLASQVLRRMERASDNVYGLLPGMMERAGFQNVVEIERFSMFMESISLMQGEKH